LVTGRISQPGSVARYNFTLDVPKTLLFDALASGSNLNWTLTGPGGALFENRSFSNPTEDRHEPVFALEQGQYTLTIDGVGDAVNAFAFRVLDFASAQTGAERQPFTTALTDGGASRVINRVPGAPLTGATAANGAWYGISNSFFEVPSAPALQPQLLTVEAWFRLDRTGSANHQAIANKANGTGPAAAGA
jgi:hypothetical protein